jgi:hypothetical protein
MAFKKKKKKKKKKRGNSVGIRPFRSRNDAHSEPSQRTVLRSQARLKIPTHALLSPLRSTSKSRLLSEVVSGSVEGARIGHRRWRRKRSRARPCRLSRQVRLVVERDRSRERPVLVAEPRRTRRIRTPRWNPPLVSRTDRRFMIVHALLHHHFDFSTLALS